MKNRIIMKSFGYRLGISTLALLTALALALCPAGFEQTALAEERKLNLVATVFPAYDFARVVAGDEAEVALLLPPGGDVHSYEPSPQDVIAIQQADLFLYSGGESDAWIQRVLDSMGGDKPETFVMMDCVTGLAEELSQSMTAEESASAEEQDAALKSSVELDEHVWTSPKNVKQIVSGLEAKLASLYPARVSVFSANAAAYQEKLDALDRAFQDTVAQGRRKVMVFGDRFPFRYFAAAYGLTYDAAFPGCSEDSEPSVKTVMSLTEFIREQSIPVVFYIEFSNRKTADILAEETGAKELLFHSCHTVSADEMAAGASYLSLMEGNVQALREALN